MQRKNIKSPYSVIFFPEGRLDPILRRHHFRKVPVFTVHTETRKRRFQKFPLWRSLLESCAFGDRFHQIRVDGRPILKEKLLLRKIILVDGA